MCILSPRHAIRLLTSMNGLRVFLASSNIIFLAGASIPVLVLPWFAARGYPATLPYDLQSDSYRLYVIPTPS